MRLLPRTLFGRILVAMFGGLLVLQAVGVWLMLEDRARFGDRLLGEYVAQRVANAIAIVDATAPAERGRMVRALSGRFTRYTLDEPWQAAGAVRSDAAGAFVARMERELENPRALQVLSIGQVDRLESEPPQAGHKAGGASRGPFQLVVAQARLGDGGVLTMRRALARPPVNWPLRTLVLLTALGLFVAGVAGWALRRVTRPLALLADAAAGLAKDLNRPPLAESGPQEVARVAAAFNAMQRDLRRLLDTRAQALAGVSHDLRLPLTRLRLRLERLPEDELRARMEEDIVEMDTMIASTVEYLRAGSAQEAPMRLNLYALIDGLVGDMEELGARVRVTGEVPRPVLAQPQAIRRCLANLFENARRYGGGEIEVRIAAQGDTVEIRIDDRGPGIPEADRERVFEPYVRLEASRARHTGGTGLGLAIARATARANGGDIALAPREGGGLSVRLNLPLAVASPSAGAIFPADSVPGCTP